jgi:hypothetical protein
MSIFPRCFATIGIPATMSRERPADPPSMQRFGLVRVD